jgi:hypothetical protein
VLLRCLVLVLQHTSHSGNIFQGYMWMTSSPSTGRSTAMPLVWLQYLMAPLSAAVLLKCAESMICPKRSAVGQA